jgi:hypothetical protein
VSPPTGLLFVTANVSQGFRTWARLVRPSGAGICKGNCDGVHLSSVVSGKAIIGLRQSNGSSGHALTRALFLELILGNETTRKNRSMKKRIL